MSRVWNVVIADDEFIIRDGIRSSVDWERLGLRVAGEAEDGEEALELAVRERANVLLVDLSMPIMNGMTLIRQLREVLPSCKVVIISGHDEFIYAQEAIQLEVDDYILKPVNPGHLTEVLERAVQKLNAAAASEDMLQAAGRQIERNLDMLRERFCNDWVGGELSREEIAEQLGFLRLPDSPPDWLGVIRWREQLRGKSFLSEKDRQLLLFAVENIVEELLGVHLLVHFRDHAGAIIVLVWRGSGSHTPDRAGIAVAVNQYLQIELSEHWMEVSNGMEGVPVVYSAVKEEAWKESRMSPFIRKAKAIVEERYADPGLTLESVAGELNVSSVYLSRMFKQETGMPFIGMLTHIRMKAAIRLLGVADLSVGEIAEQVGYESQHYFSTAFKKAAGVSPNQYRKNVNI